MEEIARVGIDLGKHVCQVRGMPMRRVAKTIKSHLDGILNAIERGVTNASLEGISSVIQWLKKSARGYRNRDRFRTAIYFHLGGLDLYPDLLSFHTKP